MIISNENPGDGIRPEQEFSAKQKKEVREALKSARSKEEYRRVQAVWLRMSMGLMNFQRRKPRR